MSTLNAAPAVTPALSESTERAIENACQRIAPSWPLDQSIAVNPWWELRDRPLAETSATLAALSRARCLMPKDHYASLWQTQIQTAHLLAAAQELKAEVSLEQLQAYLTQPDQIAPESARWYNVSDWLDHRGGRRHDVPWSDEITLQISQFCALYFQHSNQLGSRPDRDNDLYQAWLRVSRQDRGIAVLMDEPQLHKQFMALPKHHNDLFAAAIDALALPDEALSEYSHALLLAVNGWASWLAYVRWQNQLNNQDSNLLTQLLAIRLAWELVLWRHTEQRSAALFNRLQTQFTAQYPDLPQLFAAQQQSQRLTWVWQRAAELSYQQPLHAQLSEPPAASSNKDTPILQAVFCIDVRSEPMRRALEAQHPGIQTLGFAGFFGLPIDYQPTGTGFSRPQLPGLLSPTLRAVEDDSSAPDSAQRQAVNLNRQARLQTLSSAPPATFSLVEAGGLLYAFELLKNSFFPSNPPHSVNDLGTPTRWQLLRDEQPLSIREQAELAADILHALGLTKRFAPVVLLLGHGSRSANNPHAAGLDCGACGGQTGEINARVLAQLLNSAEVRQALAQSGINIPYSTRFIAGLHNTTTDDVDYFDAPAGTAADDARWQHWLQVASEQVREQRAEQLGLKRLRGKALHQALRRRANDWSQTRPEWGLANNAAFIVAPRQRTRHLDLQGRSFLHDYRWQDDQDFKILELIMTAPMVVTHWINMQYYASVTDNLRYGSGNKLLHNVVGGNLGVFEGNGGDLRIGLPLQSLHDGERWRHQPLRLSVYIAAPREAIADIAARHPAVKQLIDNDWLYLFRLDDSTGPIQRFYHQHWQPVAA